MLIRSEWGFLIVIFVFVSLGFSSCDEQEDREEQEIVTNEQAFMKNQSIVVDGLDREYHVFIPENAQMKPLVVLLHGHGGSFDQSIGEDRSKAPQKVWLSLAENEGIIVVIANGSIGPLDSRGWNDCRNDARGNPDTDDVTFLSNLIDQVGRDYNHDPARVYVAGVSNGASMAIRLAQEIPEKITAFAAIVTTMPVNSQCPNSSIPVSALFMNGTEDKIAPYDGGSIASGRGLVQSTEESVAYWVARNSTDNEAVQTEFEDLDQTDKSTAVKYLYRNGASNTEVVHYEITGGGHNEPSIEERYSRVYLAIVGEQNGDIEMANEVWGFFKTKSK